MLPFLKPKKMSAVMIAKVKPEGGTEPMHEEGEHDPAMLAAASDLISAVHSKDTHAVADALCNAFEIYEMQPHEEYGDE